MAPKKQRFSQRRTCRLRIDPRTVLLITRCHKVFVWRHVQNLLADRAREFLKSQKFASIIQIFKKGFLYELISPSFTSLLKSKLGRPSLMIIVADEYSKLCAVIRVRKMRCASMICRIGVRVHTQFFFCSHET